MQAGRGKAAAVESALLATQNLDVMLASPLYSRGAHPGLDPQRWLLSTADSICAAATAPLAIPDACILEEAGSIRGASRLVDDASLSTEGLVGPGCMGHPLEDIESPELRDTSPGQDAADAPMGQSPETVDMSTLSLASDEDEAAGELRRMPLRPSNAENCQRCVR